MTDCARHTSNTFQVNSYTRTYNGFVRLPPALQADGAIAKEETAEKQDETIQDEAAVGNKGEEGDGDDGDKNKDSNDGENEDEIDEDEEEESDEAKRRRIVRQRQKEERRRQEEEAEHQVLTVSVKCFTIPEILFRPSDAGLDANLAGLPQLSHPYPRALANIKRSCTSPSELPEDSLNYQSAETS